MSETETKDPRQVLINLAVSATLADHMGDMWNYLNEALEQIGIKAPPEVWDDDGGAAFAKWLALNHNGETVYGTSILDD